MPGGSCRDNLAADFAPYRPEQQYRIADLLLMLEAASAGREPKHLTLLVARSNKLYRCVGVGVISIWFRVLLLKARMQDASSPQEGLSTQK